MCPGIELLDITHISMPVILTPVFLTERLFEFAQEHGVHRYRWWIWGIIQALQSRIESLPADTMYFLALIGDIELELVVQYVLEQDGIIIIVDMVDLEEMYDLFIYRVGAGALNPRSKVEVPKLRKTDSPAQDGEL